MTERDEAVVNILLETLIKESDGLSRSRVKDILDMVLCRFDNVEICFDKNMLAPAK